MTAESFSQILDSIPHVVIRLVYGDPVWKIKYINKAIERWGYDKNTFSGGDKTWNELLHPDDRVVALKQSHDYMARNIDDFKLHYRILTADGRSIYITEYSHVNRGAGGETATIDSYLVENLEAASAADSDADIAIRRRLALNDILLTIQDASARPEMAIQSILDRVGALLDCSRALLFQDDDTHRTCKVVYEWCNHGISSVKDLDYSVTYSTGMPEIYIALQDTGVLLINAGEIPENCKEEFEAEGLVSSAIFAVYQYGDHYGFVCFDDCVIQRRWDEDTAQFLKVVANLLSNVIMNLQSAQYAAGYENKIRSLAFRDYATGLPNQYPYESDLSDAVIAAQEAGTPAYAVLINLDGTDAIRNAQGLTKGTQVVKAIAGEVETMLGQTLEKRAVLYRVAGSAFAVIAQPGESGPVRDFARKAAERGLAPWKVDAAEYACRLNVAVVPFGVKVTSPDVLEANLDAASVKSAATAAGLPLTVVDSE